MNQIILIVLSLFITLSSLANESKVCQKCHPTIYDEYYESSHRKASIYNNPIHKAYWKKHPKDEKGYTCAACHSPSDIKVLKTGIVTKNTVQVEEPISCVFCHTIKDVDAGSMSNTNISSGKDKEFYTAERSKKGSKIAGFETESSWFGLIKTSKSSPYHKIDYNNENYYSGNVCMGCHSHTNNEHGLDVVMLDAMIDKNDKENCISCHMPQVKGSKVTLNDSKTHAFHGIAGIYHKTKEMGNYIDFNLTQTVKGFSVKVQNHANHALFGQAYREGVLDISIQRGSKKIILEPYIFTRVLGNKSHESTPWNATMSLKDTLIYAKRSVTFTTPLKQGDIVTVRLSVRLLSKKGVEVLELEHNKSIQKLRVLKTEKFHF